MPIYKSNGNERCSHCDQTIHPIFQMDCPVTWRHNVTGTEHCYAGYTTPFAEPKEKEDTMSLDPSHTVDVPTPYVEILPSDVRLSGTKLLEKIEEIFSSKEYSKKQYTREELYDLFRTTRISFENGPTTAMHFTNPLRSEPLKTKVIKDNLGQYQVNIEGRIVTPFDSEPDAQMFIDNAQKNPMTWRD